MIVKSIRLLVKIPGEDPVFRAGKLAIDEAAQSATVERPDGSILRLPLSQCAVELDPPPPIKIEEKAPTAAAPKSSRSPKDYPRAKRRR